MTAHWWHWCASTCHQIDIGGRGQTADGASVYENGLALPIMRLCINGKIHADLCGLIRDNVRAPDQVEGDIPSMITAGETAARGLSGLLREVALPDRDRIATTVLTRTRGRNPHGSWSSSLRLDGFHDPITLCCRLTIISDEVLCDFSGSSPALPRGVNLVMTYTAAYAAFGVKCVIAPEAPNNAGALALIRGMRRLAAC